MANPYPGNERTHSQKQIERIGADPRQFVFTNPALIDKGPT